MLFLCLNWCYLATNKIKLVKCKNFIKFILYLFLYNIIKLFILTHGIYKLTWKELLLLFFLFLHSLLSFFFLQITSNVASNGLTSPSITMSEESIKSATFVKIVYKMYIFFIYLALEIILFVLKNIFYLIPVIAS